MHRQHQLWLTIRLRGASTTCRTVRQVVYAYATLTHSLCDDELWADGEVSAPTLTLSHSTRWVFTVNQLTQPTDLPCPCPALAPHRKLEAVAVEDYQLAADLKRQIDGLWDAQRAAEML